MGGSDCELVRTGWLAQPANAWSSGAYLVAAGYLLWRHRARPASPVLVVGGLALALASFGSIAFHGPQPAWAGAAHDGSIALLLLVLAAGSLGDALGRMARRRPVAAGGAGLAVVGAVLVAEAPVRLAVIVALAVGLAVVEVRRARRPSRARLMALLAFGLAVALYVLGRTGGPLCRPDSPLQPHAGWHVLTAVAAAAVLVDAVSPPVGTQRSGRADRQRRQARRPSGA